MRSVLMEFVALINCFVVLFFLERISTACNRIYQRKEIHTLSPQEVINFISAIKQLHNQKNKAGVSKYDEFVQIHLSHGHQVHGTPEFFPWHRYFLYSFEKELQKINPNISIPYWDWGIESQNPASSLVFSDSYFGGNGSGSDNCVMNGPFANWKMSFPQPHCLQRRFNLGNTIGRFYAKEIVESLIRGATDYDPFRRIFEAGPHGVVHVNIGGDMFFMQSPNDPIFWIHHAFVDKLWNEYQSKSEVFFHQYDSTNNTVNQTNILAAFSTKVEDVFDIKSLCYEYENYDPRVLRGGTPKFTPRDVNSNVSSGFPSVYNDNDDEICQIIEIAKDVTEEVKNMLDTPDSNHQNMSNMASFQNELQENYSISGIATTDDTKVSLPDQLPSEWLTMMNMEQKSCRLFEDKSKKMYQILNSGKGISVSSRYFIKNVVKSDWDATEKATAEMWKTQQNCQGSTSNP